MKPFHCRSLLAAMLAIPFLQACVTSPRVEAPVSPAPVGAPPQPAQTLKATTFDALPGWRADDLRKAWPAFLASCEAMVRKPEWKEPCTVAQDVDARDEKAVRIFFEAFFLPYRVANADGSTTGLVTGYYEPLLDGARRRSGRFQTPLYRAPDDLLTIDLSNVYPELKGMRLRGRLQGNKVVPYFSRAELAGADAVAGREIAWVADPVDAFFLQVQGSGRIHLVDTGETIRVAYADQNGYPYRSIGRYLVDRGELTLDQASAQGIKRWIAAHPERRQELLNANPSYVFFKEEKIRDPHAGPKGALGVPLTAGRSIAIDPQFIPLGAPVYLSAMGSGGEPPLQRLVAAQDAGGAIKGAVRADFFWGFGNEAGEQAGRMKRQGEMWVLLPK
ncbi:MAG: murein transglycosylase A [Burkholderiaceae bacterium]